MTDLLEFAGLLGFAGAATLSSFERLASDGSYAPTSTESLGLARYAAQQLTSVDQLIELMTDRNIDADAAMAPFADLFASLNRHTEPSTWPQALLKAWLMCGFAHDLADRVKVLDDEFRSVLKSARVITSKLSWHCEQLLLKVLETEPDQVSLLGLYGRRVIGETTAQGQRLLSRHAEISSQLTGQASGSMEELSASSQLIAQLVDLSAERMQKLGLQA